MNRSPEAGMGWEKTMNEQSSPNAVKYEIGYRFGDAGFDFMGMAEDFHQHVDSVYFPWLDMPSGRAALSTYRGNVDWAAQSRLEQDLRRLKGMGIHLNLLLNANCFGSKSVSVYLRKYICSVIAHLTEVGAQVDVVTTCSPIVADWVKRQFPDIRTRASVNMRIGTVAGMAHVQDVFDEYNVQREYNRDLARLAELKAWADARGKKLTLLANSGCFNFCSTQTFHDNLVAHEVEICEMDNVPDWQIPNCRKLLRKRENWRYVLQGSWIRPEDIHRYASMFPVMKLATRMHQNPWMVLHSYVGGQHMGAITDLLEPGFSAEFAPFMLLNPLLPKDWFERITQCDKRCHQCTYCVQALDAALVDAQEFFV